MKKILLTTFILIFTLFQGIAYTSTTQSITYTYDFSNLQIDTLSTEQGIFSTISLDECQSINTPGCPLLPIYSTNIELPVGKTIGSISTSFHLKSITTLANPILPAQELIHSDDENASFSYNLSHYQQNEFEFDDLTTADLQYKRGTPILIISMRPVNYNPVTDKLYLYDKISFTISFTDAPISQFNREYGTTYDGGLCSPSEKYDYVIITDESLNASWQPLIDHRSSFSTLACTKVTVEDIDACQDYWNATPLFNDTQSHIREFIKDAYQDWETDYILLGGDWRDGVPSQQIVPYRLFTDRLETDTYKTMPCDLYYSNLDGDWYYSAGSIWGGGPDTGANDKFSEVYIGRITAYNETMVQNAIDKIIWYDECNDNEWLNKSSFWGGNLGWVITAKAYMEELRLGTDTYRIFTGFEEWNTANPDKQINTDERLYHADLGSTYKTYFSNSVENDNFSIVNHLDHSSYNTPFGMNSWNTRYNTKPFFGYSQGCLAGRFSSSYAGCEQMMCSLNQSHAFALVLNTGYGYGSTDDTNSPSQLLNCYFWNYIFNSNETDWQLGKAQSYSKDVLGAIIDGIHHAWCYNWYSSHLFGDPAQSLKISEEEDQQLLEPLNELIEVTTQNATGVGYNATLHGILTDDGGENCNVGFEYGTTTEYGSTWTSDDFYTYVGGKNATTDENARVKQYWKSNITLKAESANYGGMINALAQDLYYVYSGGSTTNIVYQYWKNNMTERANISYGAEIGALALDDTYIYVGGAVQKVYQYWKSNMTKKAETISYGGYVNVIVVDNTYVYAGGATTRTVCKYWKSNMTKKAETINYGGTVLAISEDSTYIYVGGVSTDKVYQYWKSNMTKKAETNFGNSIYDIVDDDTYIYVGGNVPILCQYWKSNLTKKTEVSTDWRAESLAIDSKYVYAGMSNFVIQFWKNNMTERARSDNYGGYVYAISPYVPFYSTGQTFSYDVTGLRMGTLYHFRAFATNSNGTNVGLDSTFQTEYPPWDIVIDHVINYLDVSSLVSHYGETGVPDWIRDDINDDGVVNYLDASSLVSHYGESY